MTSPLSQHEMLRYSRQFPVIGINGQEQLRAAKVLCVGAGGLASGVLPYLAACGVGTIGIIDDDAVEISNLQRQVIYQEAQIGLSKVSCAAQYIQSLNSNVKTIVFHERLIANNCVDIIKQFDIIVDASDNFETRYLLNRATHSLELPLVSASIFKFEAQLSVFNYQDGPCYECLYPQKTTESVANCAQAGVIGVLPGVLGALQANEVIKIILQQGEVLNGTLLYIDLLSCSFTHYQLDRHDQCEATHGLFHSETTLEPMNKPLSQEITALSPQQLQHVLQTDPDNTLLIDVREPYEREICHIGGQHIPLSHLSAALSQIIATPKQTIFYCRSGVRSLTAAKMLQHAGGTQVSHLEGGILQWIECIDSSLAKY